MTSNDLNPPILQQSKLVITTTTPDGTRESGLALLGRKQPRKAQAGGIFLPDATMTPEKALVHLRRKISMQTTPGSNGLTGCWMLFRSRAGSTENGIRYNDFCRGLRAYGLILTEPASRTLFDQLDVSRTGAIRMHDFIDKVMGGWTSTSSSPQLSSRFDIERAAMHTVDDRPDERLTMEAALQQLRRAITQRLKSGPNGLLRCWIEFRQRAGSSKDGITGKEFERGLRAYGIPLKPELAQELHSKMDANNDGYIHIKEFIDHVMGRWSTDSNTHYGSMSAEEVQGLAYVRGKARMKQMINEKPDETLTIDAALRMLRRYITQRLKSGPNGLMRCWFEFRLRAGSTYEGITLSEFARGLKLYGIPLTPERTREFFTMMDANGDGHIHIPEFIDVVMGRWAPSSNSGGLVDATALHPAIPAKLAKGHIVPPAVGSDAGDALNLSASDAVKLLRGKIAQRLPAGSHGLQRAWKVFRSASDGTHAGVTRRGLERALVRFGLPVKAHVVQEIFDASSSAPDGLIREHAFRQIIMGRPGILTDAHARRPVATQTEKRNGEGGGDAVRGKIPEALQIPSISNSKSCPELSKLPVDTSRQGANYTVAVSKDEHQEEKDHFLLSSESKSRVPPANTALEKPAVNFRTELQAVTRYCNTLS